MKIGIPRSLLYFYYYPFWETLFQELGQEVIVSDSTSNKLMNQGVKNTISEICVPVKVFVGHLFNLLEKDVDLIYIPRFISIKKDIFFCPKFMGLPDLILNSLPEIDHQILTHHIEAVSDDISSYQNYESFPRLFNKNKVEVKKALEKARKDWTSFRNKQIKGMLTDEILENVTLTNQESDIKIGLVGYIYNIYDNYISMGILNKLRNMQVEILTFENLPDQVLNQENTVKKKMFWEFTNKILGAGYHFIKNPEIDGIIHLTAFGCGPDSILEFFMDDKAAEYNKPLMRIRIDEQTGESHLITRIEAFIDMIRYQKQKDREVVK